MEWTPPGKDCGACGFASCEEFASQVASGKRLPAECVFFKKISADKACCGKTAYSGSDVLGKKYDFVLRALPHEPSARKYIVPFRPDLVERWNIRPGEIVTGRPAGPGCPVYHALRVLTSNPVTGVLECHTVGPLVARQGPVHDVQAYHVHAFEGMAEVVNQPPVLGTRQRFLPGFCMMDLSHTGVINMVLKKKEGIHIRIEDIRIL